MNSFGVVNKKIVFALALALVIIGGYIAWVVAGDSKTEQPTQQQETNQQQIEETPLFDDVSTSFVLEEFDDNDVDIELMVPSTWEVTKTKDQGLRLESQKFTFSTTTGEEVEGNFRLYFRKTARAQDSAYIGRGVASQASEKLSYTNPTNGQRPETNLSFFGLDEASNFAFLFIAGNFSLDVGDTLGPDYGKEPGTYIIGGGYSSEALEDDLQTYTVPLDYFNQTEAYKQAIQILESLRIT